MKIPADGSLEILFRDSVLGYLTDDQLLRQLAARRDEMAFGVLVKRHGSRPC